MFKESQNRVKSIALVHERLYQSKNLGRIDFKDYVQKLITDLFRSYAVNQSMIELDLDIKDISISIDLAVPCGLIINELISNSLKYAFPNYEDENKKGLIKINFNKNGNEELILKVSDNGIGITQNEIEEKRKNSLGLQLIETLVTQLEGSLEIDSNSGTSFIIKFKDDKTNG
jgi:two-component sensor histidine kinase